MDRWIAHRAAGVLRASADPLVVDLGFGATPVTTLELADRLSGRCRAPLRVVGLEIDPQRVAAARRSQRPDVTFTFGGFEVPVTGPVAVIRAANVLRQYPEAEAWDAWAQLTARLAPDGLLVEGTCDELGRLGSWATLRAGDGPAIPETLTLGIDLRTVTRPADVAERLPKALIHRNVPGAGIHTYLSALDRAWDRAAPHGVFGPRQRWIATATALRAEGWPIVDGPARWRLGELTVAWTAVA